MKLEFEAFQSNKTKNIKQNKTSNIVENYVILKTTIKTQITDFEILRVAQNNSVP